MKVLFGDVMIFHREYFEIWKLFSFVVLLIVLLMKYGEMP